MGEGEGEGEAEAFQESLAGVWKSCVVVAVVLIGLVPWAESGWAPACRDRCGKLQVKYPFGTGAGCGDPRFVKSVRCVNETELIFTTHSGSYPVISVDYTNTVLYVADPRMSTCTQMQNSGSFGLDWTAPFKLKNDVFVLLKCDAYSSSSLCDTGSSHICTSLYTCPGVQGLGIPQFSPITSCCVYNPVNLGSANEVNLPKLGCQSYTSIYAFGDGEGSKETTDPMNWRYGIKLEYNYNLDNNNFPSACADCERSNGVCGFSGTYNSFVCVCRNGVNTTTDCRGQDYYWGGVGSHRSATHALCISGILIAVPSIWRFLL